MDKSGQRCRRVLVLTLLAAAVSGGSDLPQAHAGLYDRVKDIFELPGEVDRLKEEYGTVKERYEEAVKQLESARQEAEAFRKLQEQLMADNAKLAEQNRQLAGMVEELKAAEEGRAKQSGRVQKLIWTAVALVAGYFVFGRAARLLLRNRNDRQGGKGGTA